MEVEQDLQTRYEIYQRLGEERLIACAKDVGHLARKNAWLQIDMLLDCLLDAQAISNLVEVDQE